MRTTRHGALQLWYVPPPGASYMTCGFVYKLHAAIFFHRMIFSARLVSRAKRVGMYMQNIDFVLLHSLFRCSAGHGCAPISPGAPCGVSMSNVCWFWKLLIYYSVSRARQSLDRPPAKIICFCRIEIRARYRCMCAFGCSA